jgi:ribosomal protein RSM22 (predicted rRNA methylase)
MIHPDREIQQRYRHRKLGWRNNVDDKAMLKVLAYGPEETIAYSHYFMTNHFMITKRVFKEMKMLLPNFKPTRVLDFGCGPGTAGAAGIDVWGNELKKYTGIDMSRSMLDAAKVMIDGSGADCILWDKSLEVVKRAESRGDRYDLAISSYTMSELASDPARRAATQLLFELLDVGGYLVIIESGNPEGSHTVRTAREFILNSFNHTADEKSNLFNILPAPRGLNKKDLGAFSIAPCTHDKPCPLSEGVWCSFSQKVYSGMIRKASEEKFSYVVIQKRQVNSSEIPNQSTFINSKPYKADSKMELDLKSKLGLLDNWTIPSSQISEKSINESDPTPLVVLQKFLDSDSENIEPLIDNLLDEVDWEEYNPPLIREEWGRVIRSPIKNRGHVSMDLCLPNGSVARSTLSKSNVIHVPSLYTAMRKTTWGGLFPVIPDNIDGRSPLALKSKGLRGPNNNRDNIGYKVSSNKELTNFELNQKKNNDKSNNNINNIGDKKIGREEIIDMRTDHSLSNNSNTKVIETKDNIELVPSGRRSRSNSLLSSHRNRRKIKEISVNDKDV